MKAALAVGFRPEFLNRIDVQIIFNRLDQSVIRQIRVLADGDNLRLVPTSAPVAVA